jgi:hypothetical protein
MGVFLKNKAKATKKLIKGGDVKPMTRSHLEEKRK